MHPSEWIDGSDEVDEIDEADEVVDGSRTDSFGLTSETDEWMW